MTVGRILAKPGADPYHDRKPVHYAACVSEKGGVSALCFSRPRAINLQIATWTVREAAVTCKKCRDLLHIAHI